MNETELERMIVRLGGDSAGYRKMLDEAVGQTHTAASQIEEEGEAIEALGDKLLEFGRLTGDSVSSLLGSGLLKAATGIKPAQSALASLTETVEENEKDVKETVGAYTTLAKTVQMFTGVSQEATLSIFAATEASEGLSWQVEYLAKGLVGAMSGLVTLFTETLPKRLKETIAYLQEGSKSTREWLEAFFQNKYVQAALKGITDALVGITLVIGVLTPLVVLLWDTFSSRARNTASAVDALKASLGAMDPIVLMLIRAAAAIVGVYVAFETMVVVLHVVNWLLTVTGVKWAAGIVLHYAWVAALTVAKVGVLAFLAVLTLFNVQKALWLFLTAGGTAATVTYGFAAKVAAVATSAWAAATALLAATFTVANVAAFLGTVVALGTAFTVVAGVVAGLYGATNALWQVLADLPVTSGPIASLRDLFGDWADIVMDLVRAFQVHMPTTWELLSIGFRRAVLQVQQLFPPLWKFIEDGFLAAWRLIRRMFVLEFEAITARALLAAERMALFFSGPAGLAAHFANQGAYRRTDAANTLAVQANRDRLIAEARSDVAAALREFSTPQGPALVGGLGAVGDWLGMGDPLAGVNRELATARGGLRLRESLVERIRAAMPAASRAGADLGDAVGGPMAARLRHHLGIMDAALSGSGEARRREEQFRLFLSTNRPLPTPVPTPPAQNRDPLFLANQIADQVIAIRQTAALFGHSIDETALTNRLFRELIQRLSNNPVVAGLPP